MVHKVDHLDAIDLRLPTHPLLVYIMALLVPVLYTSWGHGEGHMACSV